jgi:hypothetical protein
MFTVHIQSPCGLQQLIEQWPSILIIRKGHSTFMGHLKTLSDELTGMGLLDYTPDVVAILFGGPDGKSVTITEGCKCYITNDAGKTIATIK